MRRFGFGRLPRVCGWLAAGCASAAAPAIAATAVAEASRAALSVSVSASASASTMLAATGPVERSGRVSVWVDLDLPALAHVPRAEREALRLKILAQQDQVMGRLRQLGAQEQARIQQVRNALAVRLDGTQLDAARAIPGVRSVRIVRDIQRIPPVSGAGSR